MNSFEEALGRYLTPNQLHRIRSLKVGIAGAGGLGSNCALALVRTGFRGIRIVDFDEVDLSNLNRQFYFKEQVGNGKVRALKRNLEAINPDACIDAVQKRIEAANAESLFSGCDVVVEALDRADCKALVVENCLGSVGLLVAASGLAGWGGSDRIRVNRIRDDFYVVGDLSTGVSTDAPPLAPCVLIAAAKQADVVLSYALGTLQGGNIQ